MRLEQSLNSYKRLCTEFYDIDKPAPPPEALDFYVRHTARAGGPILEAMCGSGRFLVPLVQRGLDVDGVDASPHMLQACSEKCRRAGLSPGLYHQFLEHLALPRRYSLVFIPGGSFGLVTDPAAARESLRRLHAHMLPEARLLLEIERPPSGESNSSPWEGRWVERPDGARILISAVGRYDAGRRVSSSIHRYDLIREGQLLETEFEYFDLRFYDPDGITTLLQEAGFSSIRLLKAHAFTPPDDSHACFVVECLKQSPAEALSYPGR